MRSFVLEVQDMMKLAEKTNTVFYSTVFEDNNQALNLALSTKDTSTQTNCN